MHAYRSSIDDLAEKLETDLKEGLPLETISSRQQQYGHNYIDLTSKFNIIAAFFEQFSNPIVLLLLGTAIIAAITGELIEAILISAIVLIMSGIGVYLEAKAGNAVEELKKLGSTLTKVIRGGKIYTLDSRELVPGDLLVLQEGDKVPADARLISSQELEINEAILTGESLPITKDTATIEKDVTLAERRNMLFSGTFVVQGKCTAIVTEIGLGTELGAIAAKLAEKDTKQTPLQEQLEKLGKTILVATLTFCGAILALELWRGQDIIDALIETLSLAVAFIPEGLGAVMTVTLALGVREMVRKQVIIKRLLAAEGLGSVVILATDKTGTITTGEMAVDKFWTFSSEINIGNFKPTNNIEKKIVEIIKYCNNSHGATEAALVKFLGTIGVEFELEAREVEHRFSSSLKRMMVIKDHNGGLMGFAKGAPDVLIPLCTEYHCVSNDTAKTLSEKDRKLILAQAESYASQGYRVLCLASREFSNGHKPGVRHEDETRLLFVALICLIDPLRAEVPETVKKLSYAGIRPIVITGDHPAIARTIALQAGIIHDKSDLVLTGDDLDKHFAGQKNILESITRCQVFARVTPNHKNELVELFRQQGFTTAMAGDGINDAIAISKADIGIAVTNATDIVKEAADVIVTGSYDALANAVEVGRVIIARTKLYLHYLLSGNFCQVGTFALCLLFNYPAPLTALSLLLINVLTDAAPAMSMAVEKIGSSVMKQKPRSSKEGIIDKHIWQSIAIQGIISSLFLFIVFVLSYPFGLATAQTATFTAYMAQKLMRGFTARSLTESVFSYGFFTNKYMVLSILFATVVWFVVIFGFSDVFKMQALPIGNLGLIILSATTMPIAEELLKWQKRRKLV